ncbi:hypothetical protein ABZP36_004194 [Zizania latifolia]
MAAAPIRFTAVVFLLLQLSCCLLASPSNSHGLLMLDRFHGWMARHGRSYPSADEKLRLFEVYWSNVEYIEATNRDGGLSYELGENEFTDLTNEEFVARYAGGVIADADADDAVITTLAGDVSEGEDDLITKLSVALPSSVDWREKGAVTPVKNQRQCGSCWAFATVAALESHHQITSGELVSLSEQEIVDCDRAASLNQLGCKGGSPLKALAWVKAKGGVITEDAYPYIVKNSWGQTWWQNGFFFIRKGASGRYGMRGIVGLGGVYPA